MSALRPTLPFLGLLVLATFCTSLTVPFMGYYIVEGLGREPWLISIYTGLAILTSVGFNKIFAKRLDRGDSAFPLIGIAGLAYLLANLAIWLVPSFWTVITIGVLGFGLSGSATSTLFSLGHQVAEDAKVKGQSFNAYMRAATSVAWMVGPAVGFLIADLIGPGTVFLAALLMSLVWLALWPVVIKRNARLEPKEATSETGGNLTAGLRKATIVCFLISFGHSLTFTALPLFYVQEVGLPTFAPGTAFSVKTFVEVFAIMATPYLISRFGLRPLLLGIAALAVVTVQLLAAVSSFGEMLAGAALEGFYYGLYASVGLSFVQSFAGGRVAHATAVYWNTIKISGLVAGPLTGLIAQYYSFHLVVQVSAIGAALAFVMLFFMRDEAEAQQVS